MEDIKTLADSLEDYFEEFEHSVIEIVCEKLQEIEKADPKDLKSLMKMQDIREDMEEIEEEREEIIDKAEEEIYNIVEEYAREYYEEASEHYEGELEPYEENEEIRQIVEETKREVCECFSKNLNIEAIGIIDSEGEFKNLEQGYREIVNEAIKEVIA